MWGLAWGSSGVVEQGAAEAGEPYRREASGLEEDSLRRD